MTFALPPIPVADNILSSVRVVAIPKGADESASLRSLRDDAAIAGLEQGFFLNSLALMHSE